MLTDCWLLQQLNPSQYFSEMSMDTETWLASQYTMKIPKKTQLLDMYQATLRKVKLQFIRFIIILFLYTQLLNCFKLFITLKHTFIQHTLYISKAWIIVCCLVVNCILEKCIGKMATLILDIFPNSWIIFCNRILIFKVLQVYTKRTVNNIIRPDQSSMG